MPKIFKAKFIVGIDPGKNTGIAYWIPAELRLAKLLTVSFWETYDFLATYGDPENTAIILENPGVNKPTFGRGKLKRKILDRKAQNVGSNKREAILLGEGLEREGYVVKYVAPVQAEKWDAKMLEKVTGWKGRTSQHARDAARLVFNRGSRIVIPE